MDISRKVHPATQTTKTDWPMIAYGQRRIKSAQSMLYEAAVASDVDTATKKWEKFVKKTNPKDLSDEQVQILINNLDDQKQWAAIHHAVHANNIHVFKKLTEPGERYRCDICIKGGNGENVLHIIARSHCIWANKPKESNENLSRTTTTAIENYTKVQINQSNLPQIVCCIIERILEHEHKYKLKDEINHQDNEGRTPLHLAVQANRYEFAKELIDQKVNIMVTTKLNATVLFFALLSNEANGKELNRMVELILESVEKSKREEFIRSATLDNQTPLARALCHPAVTQELITKLLCIDSITGKQCSITREQWLFVFDEVARYQKHSDKAFGYLQLLIVEMKKQDSYQMIINQLPHVICRHDNRPLLEWFYQNTNKSNMSNMNEDDYGGYAPLLTAILCNSKECVQFLLEGKKLAEYQKNFDAINEDQENILHICAKHHIKEDLFNIIWRNLSSTYDYPDKLMSMKDAEGHTPLEVAACSGNENVCQTLCDHMKTNPVRETYLLLGRAAHEASKAGHLKVLKLFIGPDLDINETPKLLQLLDEYGHTCLHLAAAEGKENIVEFLVNKAKPDVDVIGDRHQTPLHLACQNGHLRIVRILLKKGASIGLRDAEVNNSLEIAIVNRQKDIVQELLKHPSWAELMRNAQPIEHTEAFDTPMRKLIRYMPEMAIWLIENRLTTIIGGPGQKTYKTTYDYEFYEDIHKVRDWYTQGVDPKSVLKPITCESLWHNRGIEAIHTCWCCCHSNGRGCRSITKETIAEEWYTNDAYTLVRNHPLFIVSQQWDSPELVEHAYHTHLHDRKFSSFGFLLFFLSCFSYMAYLALFTSIVLMGKHPKFFYDKAKVNMTVDLTTCEYVAIYLTNNPSITNEIFTTNVYKGTKWTFYGILIFSVAKNLITIAVLFPKVFRVGGSYIEISALVLSYVYVLDWFDWQNNLIFRCPVQYQLGAMGILLSYINFLLYLRINPVFNIGIYVVMLQVIFTKFLRFLPILLVIICGFGFTYWMLLQYQTVYGTPIEALMRTGLMLFDLGYEDRLYGEHHDDRGYYKLVYVIFMLTAIACSIFVINLLIGLAVGEIPTLLTQGTLWRIQLLYSLLSDYEILRIRLTIFFDCLTCNIFRDGQIPWFRPRPYSISQKDELQGRMGKLSALWEYTQKHFFHERIQDNIEIRNRSTDQKTRKFFAEILKEYLLDHDM